MLYLWVSGPCVNVVIKRLFCQFLVTSVGKQHLRRARGAPDHINHCCQASQRNLTCTFPSIRFSTPGFHYVAHAYLWTTIFSYSETQLANPWCMVHELGALDEEGAVGVLESSLESSLVSSFHGSLHVFPHNNVCIFTFTY